MEKDKYLVAMSEAVQAHWHEVKDEAMLVVQNRLQVQQVLSEVLEQKQTGQNSNYCIMVELIEKH